MKRKVWRKFSSFALTLAMLLGFLPVTPAMAADVSLSCTTSTAVFTAYEIFGFDLTGYTGNGRLTQPVCDSYFATVIYNDVDDDVDIGPYDTDVGNANGKSYSRTAVEYRNDDQFTFSFPAPGVYSFFVNFDDILGSPIDKSVEITYTDATSAPIVSTTASTGVTSAGATLNGTVNANGASTTVTFEYGTTASYGSTVTATQSPLTGPSETAVNASVTGLEPNTTYHYRVKGTNTGGTATGDDMTFTTTAAEPVITSISPESGTTAGGTSVAITGTDFTSGSTVKFGATSATRVTYTSETSLTAVSPAGPEGTVHITVTTSGGTSTTSPSDQFTYDGTAPTATVAAQTVKGGASITVQSTETGTVYLVDNALASTAIDSVAELDTLVTGGTATKATIGTANTDTTITAPAASGAYAAVAADAAENVSAKTANLVTVDATAPVAAVSAQTVKGGVNVTVQSTETGTVYLVGNALASTAIDSVAELDALVTGGTATKVTIGTANTDTTITAPAASGAYAAVAADAAGNVSAKTANLVTVDGTVPTVIITSTAPAATNTSPISVTITFSEAVTGFTLDDITVGNGTAGNFSSIGTTYTADITPSAQGAVTVDVAAGVAADAAGNVNTAAGQLIRTYDSAAPSVVIESAASSYTNTSPIPVTITFSESVTGFTADDISVTNGTKGILSGSGASYSISITPSAQGAVTVDVAADIASDTAGNANTAAAQLSRTYDSSAPAAPTVTSTAASTNDTTPEWTWTAGGGENGTFRYKLDDSTLTSGATETVAASYTPSSALSDGSHTLYVQERDDAGNWSASGSYEVTVDGTAPTVSISSAASATTNTSPIPVTITFSEGVVGFSVGDITVGNGTADNFASTDAKTYTADITPTTQGAVTVDVAVSVASDAAGNSSTAATQFSRTYDSTVPTVSVTSTASATTNTSPIPVAITFSESVTGFVVGDITVGNGSASNFSGSGTTYTVDITPTAQGAVTVDVAADMAADAAGNSNTAATQLSRTYDSTAPTAPTVTSTAASTNDTTPEWTWTPGGGGNGTYRYKLDDNDLTSDTTETTTPLYTPSSALSDDSYTLYVQERDEAGNWSASGSYTVTIDGTAPTVNITSTALSYTNTSPIPVTITFSENVTGFAAGDITVGNGTAGNFASVDAKTYTADITPTAQGAVTVNVAAGVAADAAGNSNTAATQLSRTYDGTVPTISSAMVSSDYKYIDITFSEGIYGANDGATALTAAKLALTFTQNSGTATNAVIASVKKADNTSEASASALSGGETTVRVFLTVTGTPSGTETITITPKDGVSIFDIAGNAMLSTQTTGAKKLYTPVSSGGGSSASTDSGAAVIVNGESKTAGTAQTTTNSSGQTTTTVTVDTGKLENILASKDIGATVTIPIMGNSDVAAGTLTGAMVKSMENKNATLVVQTDSGTYTLPASEINIDAVSRQLGTSVSLSDINVTVSISEPSASMTQVVENAAQDGGFTIMVPAVDYNITCTHGSQTVNVTSFNSYVERTIAIPDGVDPSKITTGVVVNPDGTTHHVPTRVTVIGGKYYAIINSLTNSTYSVVWNPIEFSDMASHWAKDAVNDMGSRMVVTGVGNNNYAPDRNMTRAEFAAIMVRALGLEPGTGASGFGDVAATDWCCGYIKTAASYGIIKGYANGNFGPNDTITREQSMAMIARAMKITGLTVGLTSNDISALLGAYTDGASVSDYAKDCVAACLKTGITSGTGNATISSKDYITRAEVAVMVQRLLQKSGLI